MTVEAYLGLGSNIGDRYQHVTSAMTELDVIPEITVLQRSTLYHTKPVGPQDQPDFINVVVAIETSLSPQALLVACQDLENQHGRQRIRHWGERTLDIDILLYGEEKVNQPDLVIPHPHMLQRDFVLTPLAEIAPDLVCSLQQSCLT